MEKIQAVGAIASVAFAGGLGVIGWQLGGENNGFFMATILGTQCLLAIALYIGNYRTVAATLPTLIGRSPLILRPGSGLHAFLSNLLPNDELYIIATSDQSSHAVAFASGAASRCKVSLVLPPRHALNNVRQQCNFRYLFSLIEASFTMAVRIRGSDRIILLYLPNDDVWVQLPNDLEYSELARQVMAGVTDMSFNPNRAVDADWLASKLDDVGRLATRRLSSLAQGRLECNTPNAIYSEQLRLSDGADQVSALDMTDISEWLEPHGLGGCIEHNARTAERRGPGSVRRIIYIPSREYFASKPDYSRQLIEVIKMHSDRGVDIGIIFQTDLADKGLIVDSVLYRGAVLWVETTPTTRFAGNGYFTTLRSDVESFQAKFDALWRGEHCPNPANEATRLLEAAAGQGSAA